MKLFRTINVKLWSIIFGITTLLFIVSIVGDIITDNYESVINIAFNTSSTKIVTDENDTTDTAYFKSAYKTAEEAKAASRAIAEEITAEGAVLLKNANQALPLSKTANVTIFGHSSANTIVCGTGSADIDDTDAVDFKTAIESKTDLKINEDMWNFYSSSEILKKYETNPKKGDNSIRNGADGVTKGEYTVNEVPWNLLPNSKNDSKYKDAAIVVFSRLGGEMYDLPADVAHQGNTKETVNSSGNSLELTIQERELLKEIEAAGYKKTIVLINSANALECDFVDEAALGVDACMWIGYTGLFGLASCGGNGVEVYTIEAKFNSEEVNQWKTLYLVDEDNYILTVKALDSKDMTTVTADFYMAGTYEREGDTVTLAPGYGYCKAMNGSMPIEMPVAGGGAMYAAMMGTTGYVYTLSGDTFTPAA